MIIGLGLPRTGTKSLYSALSILGYNGSHFCDLTGKTGKESINDTFMIDNSVYDPNKYVFSDKDSYILTIRNENEWNSSIDQWDYDGPSIKEHYFKFLRNVQSKNIKFLVYDVKNGWDPLCKFLNRGIPTTEFPHEI